MSEPVIVSWPIVPILIFYAWLVWMEARAAKRKRKP